MCLFVNCAVSKDKFNFVGDDGILWIMGEHTSRGFRGYRGNRRNRGGGHHHNYYDEKENFYSKDIFMKFLDISYR